jgi:hypothetical protein
MMAPEPLFSARVTRGSPLDIFGRMTAAATHDMAPSPIPAEGYILRQEDVESITVKSFDEGVQLGSTQTPDVSSVIYDTLQTSAIWGKVAETGGGNIRYQVPASLFDTESEYVRIVVCATLTDDSLAYWLTNVAIQQPTK